VKAWGVVKSVMVSRAKAGCRSAESWLKTVLACLAINLLASGQATGPPPQSPKQVVQAYRNMDANGARLTAAGWKTGNVFFLHPGPPPSELVLGVMAAGELIGEANISGNKAEVWTEFDLLGRVYPTGQFSRSLGGSPPVDGPLPSRRKYELTFTGTQWKIDDFESSPMVTVAVAIRYLDGLRGKSNNYDVRQNAERSIPELVAIQNKGAK
jgi:hypothetical protein